MPENQGGHLQETSGLLRWGHPSAWHRAPHQPYMCHPGRPTDWPAPSLARRTRVQRLQPDWPSPLWQPCVRNESTSPRCVTNTGFLLGLCSWLSTLHKIRGVAPRFFEAGILIPISEAPVSGNQTPAARVHLVGAVMVNLVGAIPRVQELFELPVIVGGLAVMSRLGNAYRVTQDLDALRRRLEGAASGWKCYGQPEPRKSTRSADLFLLNGEMCALTCSRPGTTISIENSPIPRIDLRRWRMSGHW